MLELPSLYVCVCVCEFPAFLGGDLNICGQVGKIISELKHFSFIESEMMICRRKLFSSAR